MGEQALFEGQPVLEFAKETDRRNFLRHAGLVGVGATLAAGGLGAAPAFAAGKRPATQTRSQQMTGDIGILNFALTLEYLEADFYARGVRCGILHGREQELVEPIGDHEKQHVAAITATIKDLGGTPVAKPKFDYPFLTFRSSLFFLRQARKFEELGVHAYHGQVTLINSTDVLAAAASIAGVESRHAAILDKLTWHDPFPRPIEKPESKQEVLRQVKPYIDSGSDHGRRSANHSQEEAR